MSDLIEEQQKRNRLSRDAWERFRPHRERVTRLLRDAAPQGGRLCVLGAGNSNDLDLNALLHRFAEVHLVDLDARALEFAVSQQDCQGHRKLHVHGGVELTGIDDRLAGFTPRRPPAGSDVDACLQAAARSAFDLPGPFDVVASVCLLTQLLERIVLTLGEQHPRFLELLTQVRARHLQLLMELSRPGGVAVLVVDFVSSVTCPELPQVPEGRLARTAAELIRRGNFFTGVNPLVIHSLFQTDPTLAAASEPAQMTEPWLWDFGPRVYAVCGVVARRKAAVG
jgi:hypothetical protein